MANAKKVVADTEFQFSESAQKKVCAAVDAALDASKKHLLAAEQMHDDGIQSAWLIVPTEKKPNAQYREPVRVALGKLVTSRLSERQRSLIETDPRLLPPASKSGDRRDRRDALDVVDRQIATMVRHLQRIERELSDDKTTREAAMLAAWCVKYLEDGIDTINGKPKHLVDCRKFEAADVLKTAIGAIKKLPKVVS